MDGPWQSITEAFDDAAAAHADRFALRTGGGKAWTYAQPRSAASRLAAALARRLPGPDAVVALALPKSAEWVVGALAAWRAGVAFTPLDPNLAVDRFRFLLDDASPCAAFATPQHESLFRAAQVPVIARPGDAEAPPVPLRREMLAYRICTSGSTGEPKGVDVEHRGLAPLLRAQIEAFDLRAGDQALWFFSPCFDASLSDVGTALLAEATLHIEPVDVLRDLDRLVRVLHERQITHWDLPPALLGVLDPESLPRSLRTLIVGGEASPPEVVRRWAKRFRLVNVYGPTEATICSSLNVCDPQRWDAPLLGQPTPGVRYLVLDADQNPLLRGAVGELAIGGPGVARGYHRRPELTASRFVQRHGERLFRTGDRVHWRDDGEYVHLGRLDRQVKILGQLVAPEEVETSLRTVPGIQQAVVLKRRLASGEREGLVAFYTAEDPAPTPVELGNQLSAKLPRWLVPARFVRLPELPRTPTGKPDLSALAAMPLPEEFTDTATFEGASAGGELRELLRRFLGVQHIDSDRSFWDHGGDSLTLLRVAQAAHARGMNLAPARLAQAKRLADLLEVDETDTDAMHADELRRDAAAVLARLELPAHAATTRTGPPTCLLLTGATGFLGSYLLGDFLRQPLARNARRVLVCDTDPRATCVWSEALFGDCPAPLRELADARRCDLYLLLDIDTPWVADPVRYLPDNRRDFFDRCEAELRRSGAPCVVIRGEWEQRFEQAKCAVEQRMAPPG